MTSSVTYKDFSISTEKNYKPDYSDPFVQSQFQRGKVYRIWMDDNKRVIDFKLYEVREDRLVGVYAKNNFEKSGFPAKIEIPFERINHIETKKPFVLGTVAIIGS